jgi:hypothetical protein
MSISDLNALVAILLAIALAAERFVTFLKNVFPWLADHPPGSKNAPTDGHEWLRRTSVQTIGFVAAWLVSGYLSSTTATWSPLGSMAFGDGGGHKLPVWVVGLLASSGSALWSSVLGLTSAAKDIRKQTVVSTGIDINERQTGALTAAPAFKH